ncbi:Calcitonin gene-related peptide type 1 receptor [Halotydeus destructor]|nr:Calcitonin gene-related peptide type 1 receptor [Halotydeus destructor]
MMLEENTMLPWTSKEAELSKLEASPYTDIDTGQAFDLCFETVLSKPLPPNDTLYCPRTFDGWACWNNTPAGEYAYVPCPSFVTGFRPERLAFKTCMSDGTWFTHPLTNKTWSNYTTCVDHDDYLFRQKINNLYIAGYTISVIALLISLAIFFSFSQLKCDRITIHKNFFISFIINNTIWIIWYTFVIKQTDVIKANPFQCQALHVVVHYFLLCNYFWMFCEGLYLHTLLIVAFVSGESVMKWFYVIGWAVPLPIITVYAILRGSSESHLDTDYCWIEDSKFIWIVNGPVCVTFLLNLVFLVNIVRVLVTKLRAFNSPDTHQTRKAVRATLILIPLLGLQYMLTPFRPPPGSPAEAVYEIIAAAVTSLQGLFVALLFCFCNGQVLAVLRKFFTAAFPKPQWQPISKKDRNRSLQTTV